MGSIEIFGDKKLSIRINGRPASERDIAVLDPKNILRVDYISNPGLRYGNADGVLDVIIRQPQNKGYSLYLNLLQSANRGWGDYTGALKYNRGKSEWSIDYHSNPMWNMDCYRDNNENIILPDGISLQREETGRGIPNRMVTHKASIQYSYAEGRDILLNVQGRLFRTDNKYRTRGDITTVTDNSASVSTEYEENPTESLQGDLDIYLYKRLKNSNSLHFNIVPSVISSESRHIYQSDNIHIYNKVQNHGCRLVIEGIWERKISIGSLSAGLRSLSSWNSIRNNPGNIFHHDKSNENYVFAEWKGSTPIWQWRIESEGVYYYGIDGYLAINPGGFVIYSPSAAWSAMIYLNSKRHFPGINDLNVFMEQIDTYKWSTGNRNVKPYSTYTSRFELNFKSNSMNAGLSAENVRSENPITIYTSYIDGKIVHMPINSDYNNMMEFKCKFRGQFLHDMFTSTLEVGWHRYDSHGINYRHDYSQIFYNLQLMFMKNGWWGMIKYNNSYHCLWGEMITSSTPNLMNIGAGYTYRCATFMIGVVNPFGNVAVKTRNLSAIAGYDRIYQASGSNRLLWIGVTLNLRGGKSRSAVRKKIDNASRYESVTNSKK